MVAETTIIYEQPLNEQIRLCLRLEFLFEQVNHHLIGDSVWDLRQALNTILEILRVTDRPDLKNKLGQTLNQYATSLAQLEQLPNVDKGKLHSTLKQVDQLIDDLRINAQKIGQELRDNEFLTDIRQRTYTPAGTCNFSLPSYYLWLQQNQVALKQQLSHWLDSFGQLKAIIDLMLKLTRESAFFKQVKAIHGFYQSNLDAEINYQLIRISLPAEKNLFPEISAGRHHLAVHFFTIDTTGHTIQIAQDVIFDLACCKF